MGLIKSSRMNLIWVELPIDELFDFGDNVSASPS